MLTVLKPRYFSRVYRSIVVPRARFSNGEKQGPSQFQKFQKPQKSQKVQRPNEQLQDQQDVKQAQPIPAQQTQQANQTQQTGGTNSLLLQAAENPDFEFNLGSGTTAKLARSLFQITAKVENQNDLIKDFQTIKSLATALPDVGQEFLLKTVPQEEQAKFVTSLLDQIKATNETKLIFAEIVESRMLPNTLKAINYFLEYVKRALHQIDVTIITAKEIQSQEEQRILQTLKDLREGSDCTFIVHKEIDPSIVGGFIARLEGKELDRSVRQDLNYFRNKLRENFERHF